MPTDEPTAAPNVDPTAAPTISPTVAPTVAPTEAPTSAPVVAPTVTPTVTPTIAPQVIASESPTIFPSSVPSAAPIVTRFVRVEDYYISFVAPGSTAEPTEEEYSEMLNRTTNYFQEQFTAFFANNPDTTFISIDSASDFNLYGAEAGIPRPEFNIYMNFNVTELEFAEGSVIPPAIDIFTIMKDSMTVAFITDVVRTFTPSQFDSTNEVFFAATELVSPSP